MKSSSPWINYYQSLYANEDLGFFLDLGNCGISHSDMADFELPFKNAMASIESLEAGAIANPDEDRMVGHYWLRTPELAPTSEIKTQIIDTFESVKTFSKKIMNGDICTPDDSKFTNAILIGIGGSALGPQLIADTLDSDSGLKINFLDNTDPDGIDRLLKQCSSSLPKTLIIVISKSGGTAETRNAMLEVRNIFTSRNLDFSAQSVAVTGVGSQLFQQAQSEKWLATFPMWDWVGGRTSVMSAVGLLPAALMGIDIDSLLSGASEMDAATRTAYINHNPAGLLALAWYNIGNGRGSKDMVIIPYKDRLQLFSKYLQQLIMESLGKSHDLEQNLVQQGIAVYGNKGSTDQHAYVQQLRDGIDNFFVTFIEVLADRNGESILVDSHNTSGDFLFGFHRGTETALSQNDRRSLTITISELSPKSMGALIALYERAVGIYAALININAYHQPGVEAGKKAARNVLEIKNNILYVLRKLDHPVSIQELADLLSLQGNEILIYQIVRHHAANHPLSIEGSIYKPESLKISLSSSKE